MNTLDTVQQFIGYIFSHNMEKALLMVAPEAQFIAARTVPHPDIPIYEYFTGPKGAQTFFNHFTTLLEPGDFTIQASFSQGNHAALYGTLRHRSRQTGRDFSSDWALICRVEEGYLTFYHFYEDTLALEQAVVV